MRRFGGSRFLREEKESGDPQNGGNPDEKRDPIYIFTERRGQRRDKCSPIDDDIAEFGQKLTVHSKSQTGPGAGEAVMEEEAGILNEDSGDEETDGQEDVAYDRGHSIPAESERPGHE
jgi:hypothetical protein